MNLDPDFEASFVRIIGLLGFILATVAFFLMMAGMAGYPTQDAGSVLFMAFIMCTALAFVGLMISTLAQVLKTLQNIEKLLADQKKDGGGSTKSKTTTKKKKAA